MKGTMGKSQRFKSATWHEKVYILSNVVSEGNNLHYV